MRGLRHILAVALLLPTISFAGWSVDLPLSDMPPTNAPVDTYARYIVDMLKAVGERAEITRTSTQVGNVWAVDNNSMAIESRTWSTYGVLPPQADAFNLDYVHPQAFGQSLYHYLGWSLYTDGSLTNINLLPLYMPQIGQYWPTPRSATNQLYVPQQIARQELVWTNFTTVTNYSTLIYTRLDGTVVTNIEFVGVFDMDGEFTTNVVYDAIHTNMYPSYGTNITGPAYMLLNWRQMTSSGIRPSDTDVRYYSDIVYDSYATTQLVTSPRIVQVTNAVTNAVIELNLWDTASKSYVPAQGKLSYTNYYFDEDGLTTTEVVSAGMALSLTQHVAVAADPLLVRTPYIKLGIDDAALDPMLMPYISWLILECAPYYINTAVIPSYASANSWTYKWLTPDAMRPAEQYGPGTNAWVLDPVKELTHYTPETLLVDSGAGTNLFRYSVSVNTNTYTNATDTTWYTLSSTDININVPGWQEGNYTTQLVNIDVPAYTNAISTNLGFNAIPPHIMQVQLAKFKTKPLSEDAVTFSGFTKHFWFTPTNSSEVVTNDTGDVTTNITTYTRTVYAPQDWLESINGLTATNAGTAWGNYDYYEFPGRPEAIIGWPGGWVIVDDYSNGLAVVSNWEGLYGTNIIQAVNGFHQHGYPTKADDRVIGWPTLNYADAPEKKYPSGYYFPGGTVRPTRYTVGLMYSDGLDIVENNSILSGDRNRAIPYWLDRMPLEYLAAWSNTYITVRSGAPNATTVVAPISIPIAYRYFHVDELGVTAGLAKPGGGVNLLQESNAVTIASLNEVQETNRAVLDVYSTSYTSAVATTIVVDADAVWVDGYTNITDSYYIADVIAVTNIEWMANTNMVAGVADTNILYTTNVTYRPTLVATNEDLPHDPTYCVNLITVSVATSNTVAVFDTTIDKYGGSTSDDFIAITPDAIDARYTAINALRATSTPINSNRLVRTAYDIENWYTNARLTDLTYETSTGVVITNYVQTSGAGSVGSDVFAELYTGPSDFATNVNSLPQWTLAQGTYRFWEDFLNINMARISAPGRIDWMGELFRFGQPFNFSWAPSTYEAKEDWLYPDGGIPPPSGIISADASQTSTYTGWERAAGWSSPSGAYGSRDVNSVVSYDTDIVYWAAKPSGIAGSLKLYMYVDYRAWDYQVLNAKFNPIEWRQLQGASAPVPYWGRLIGLDWYLVDPAQAVFASRIMPVQVDNVGWGPAIDNRGSTPFKFVSATNYYAVSGSTNRALTVPSHESYPLDTWLTPYQLKQYGATTPGLIGDTEVTVVLGSLGLPAMPPLGSVSHWQTNFVIPDLSADVTYQNYWAGGTEFYADDTMRMQESATSVFTWTNYNALPCDYRSLNVEILFEPEFEYHD